MSKLQGTLKNSVLETKRLQIIPLSLDLLLICNQDRCLMEDELGLNMTKADIDEATASVLRDALGDMIDNVRTNSAYWRWYTNWEIVLKSDNRIIGGAAFFSQPDENCIVEIGYVIQEGFRRCGYAFEALGAMLGWAFSNGAKVVRAEIERNNLPSINLVKKLGMKEFACKESSIVFEIFSKMP